VYKSLQPTRVTVKIASRLQGTLVLFVFGQFCKANINAPKEKKMEYGEERILKKWRNIYDTTTPIGEI
jgi:hypothetical protein